MEAKTRTKYDGNLTPEFRALRVGTFKDVMEQALRIDNPVRYRMARGYLVAREILPPEIVVAAQDRDLQDFADEVQKRCECCFRGGLVMSMARLYDNLPMELLFKNHGEGGEFGLGPKDTQEAMREHYTLKEILALEAVFERDVNVWAARAAVEIEIPLDEWPGMTQPEYTAAFRELKPDRDRLYDEVLPPDECGRFYRRCSLTTYSYTVTATELVHAVCLLAIASDGDLSFLWDNKALEAAERRFNDNQPIPF